MLDGNEGELGKLSGDLFASVRCLRLHRLQVRTPSDKDDTDLRQNRALLAAKIKMGFPCPGGEG
jgi:hypothetical protein